jgi:hypothetical protein
MIISLHIYVPAFKLPVNFLSSKFKAVYINMKVLQEIPSSFQNSLRRLLEISFPSVAQCHLTIVTANETSSLHQSLRLRDENLLSEK